MCTEPAVFLPSAECGRPPVLLVVEIGEGLADGAFVQPGLLVDEIGHYSDGWIP
jgi:hypothetical protein